MWLQGFDLDGRAARLSRATSGQPFDLFTTESDLRGFGGAHARLGIFLSRTISVEAGVRYAKPTFTVRISGDAELADDEEAIERLSHYVFDGSVLFHVTRAAFAGDRGLPFFSIGAGHLRELHDGNELVETGTTFHVTGGIKYWWGSRGRRFGLRGEAGLAAREGGADGGDARRVAPMALGGLSVLF